MPADQLFPTLNAPGKVVAFRYSSYDVPFWVRPTTRPGRWNRAGDPPTQYWSLTPSAAWAELIRYEDLHSETDLDLLRMPLWICRVSMPVVDLRDDDVRESWGVTEDDLLDEDWGSCQDLRGRVERRAAGIVSPSAALPSDANLTFFGARRAIDWMATPALASAVPATLAALGRPPTGLLGRVRRKPEDQSMSLF